MLIMNDDEDGNTHFIYPNYPKVSSSLLFCFSSSIVVFDEVFKFFFKGGI